MTARRVVDQYAIRQSQALCQTIGYPYAPFPEIGCLDAPEYLPLGAHEGWQSEWSDGRITTGVGGLR